MKKSMKLVAIAVLAAISMGANAATGICNESAQQITVHIYDEFKQIGASQELKKGMKYTPQTKAESGSYAVNFYVIDTTLGRFILVLANRPYYFRAPAPLSTQPVSKITGKILANARGVAAETGAIIDVILTDDCDAGARCCFSVKINNNNISITETTDLKMRT